MQQTYFVFIVSFYPESAALWRNSKLDITIAVFHLKEIELQLFTLDDHLHHLHNPELPTAEVVVPSSTNSQSGVFPLNDRHLQELYDTTNPLEGEDSNGKTLS